MMFIIKEVNRDYGELHYMHDYDALGHINIDCNSVRGNQSINKWPHATYQPGLHPIFLIASLGYPLMNTNIAFLFNVYIFDDRCYRQTHHRSRLRSSRPSTIKTQASVQETRPTLRDTRIPKIVGILPVEIPHFLSESSRQPEKVIVPIRVNWLSLGTAQ